MEYVWIMDSGCSRHMTGHRKWFSSLNPVSTKEYITFGDNGQGFEFVLRRVHVAFLMMRRPLFALCYLLVLRVDLTSISGPAHCLVASPSADIWKWHRRLGHLSFDLLVRLSSMGLIRGLPKLKAEKDLVCHPCHHGKMWYVLVIVDDFSRFSWVFFMEFKDEAFGCVWDLVLRLRNENHKAMRAIRSDNGREFRNSQFENFCRDLGLEHQFSATYTPP
ncbi:LOW QUALITY PROTEIN: hypothetical protein U9M48_008524 [Paspalum notatum var. saurae]|uniref:Integrase catalytic domain-containing protein n=1 Tax=Paspalum notatum var. saurae TaxID=547442 RepID=A0AAQ3WDK4_PASNO